MKKLALLVILGMVLALCLVVVSYAHSKMDLKAGDEVYVCNCGGDCPCGTIAKNTGNCTCGKPMVKTTVTKDDQAGNISADGQKKTSRSGDEIACACGTVCKCGAISHSPGKCTCGKDMKNCLNGT
jgi:hypothetical protein